MPKFQVSGSGRDSGRKRKRTYDASDEHHARAQAEADGTAVAEVIELPPTETTEGQRMYAADLGIIIPEGINFDELSSLINLTTWRDKVADSNLKELAAGYGVAYNKYSGKKYIFVKVFEALSIPGREQDLAAWFAYRVYREQVNGATDVPITSPAAPEIQAIAAQLVSELSVIQSIRRYRGDSLIWFGRYTAPNGAILEGGSNRTNAYRTTAALVRLISGTTTTTSKRPSGCLGVFVTVIVLIGTGVLKAVQLV